MQIQKKQDNTNLVSNYVKKTRQSDIVFVSMRIKERNKTKLAVLGATLRDSVDLQFATGTTKTVGTTTSVCVYVAL